MTHSTEWGMRSYQDKPDSTSWGGQNVYDVYSKAEGTGARRHEIQGLVGDREMDMTSDSPSSVVDESHRADRQVSAASR